MNIQSGDLLLFRPTGCLGKIVAGVTGSKYCHVAVIAGDHLLEYREFAGFRELPWRESVEQWGDEPDVFRVALRGEEVANVIFAFRHLVQQQYGWWHAIIAGMTRRMPDWLFRDCQNHPPHCSEAVCRAFWLGAMIKLVPGKTDWRTTPGDIAKSEFVKKIKIDLRG